MPQSPFGVWWGRHGRRTLGHRAEQLTPLQKRLYFIYKTYPADVFVHVSQIIGRRILGLPLWDWYLHDGASWFGNINRWYTGSQRYAYDAEARPHAFKPLDQPQRVAASIWREIAVGRLPLRGRDAIVLHELPATSPFDAHLPWIAQQVNKELKTPLSKRTASVLAEALRTTGTQLLETADGPRHVRRWEPGAVGRIFLYAAVPGQHLEGAWGGGPGVRLVPVQKVWPGGSVLGQKIRIQLDPAAAALVSEPEPMPGWWRAVSPWLLYELVPDLVDTKEARRIVGVKPALDFLKSSKLEPIIDWANATRVDLTQLTWRQARSRSGRWHAQFAPPPPEVILDVGDKAQEQGGKVFRKLAVNIRRGGKGRPGKLVKQWQTGWTLQHLTTKDQLADEGRVQNHCVGSYCSRVQTGQSIIYSLRDAEGRSVITLELRKNAKGRVKAFQAKGRDDRPVGMVPKTLARLRRKLKARGVAVRSNAVLTQIALTVSPEAFYWEELIHVKAALKALGATYADNRDFAILELPEAWAGEGRTVPKGEL